jgi:hypothetical protein
LTDFLEKRAPSLKPSAEQVDAGPGRLADNCR